MPATTAAGLNRGIYMDFFIIVGERGHYGGFETARL